MKHTTLACVLGLALAAALPGAALADRDVKSALADCRDEAVSTGLEAEQDIQYYIDLCMQSFAGMTGYGDAEYTENAEPAASEQDSTTTP